MPHFFDWYSLGWRDAVDVVVVAVVLYYVLLAIRGTRAVPILYGIVILLGVQALSFFLKLQSTYFVIRGLVLSILVALPIVFQPELRRALMHLGGSLKAPFHHVRQEVLAKIVNEISWAANILSQTHTGAIIVIERETGLEEYIERGVKIDGDVSAKLLMSIFQKTSPLHDGAVILRGEKVLAAACYLPLSEVRLAASNPHTGTRHRAALGLSEETDAVIVVVSEETGDISIAHAGFFGSGETEETLQKHVLEYLSQAGPTPARPPAGPNLWQRFDAWVAKRRRSRARQIAMRPAASLTSADSLERADAEPARSSPPRAVSSEGIFLDEEAIAEKQRQTEKAVEKRALEARRREERRKDDELRKPTTSEGGPESGEVQAITETGGPFESDDDAPLSPRPPRAGRASPTAPRIEDTLHGRQ